MFCIPDKDGRDVNFVLNEEQAQLDAELTGRDIIAKARQLGFSTYVLGLFLARCLMYRNRKCVIVSHSTDSTQKLLRRIAYMIKHMKGAKPELKYNTQAFIEFGKMDSSIYIGTAGSPDFGVGDTITDLHCSEVSRWKNPGPLLSGLFQTVPTSGNIIIESTGRGTGNWFHRSAMRAAGGGMGYKLHFFSWTNRKEYNLESREDFHPDEVLEEPILLERGLTISQLQWRRMKIAELDGDVQQFKEQYPLDLAECFQATGNSFFSKINYRPSDKWKRVDPWTHRHCDHPLVYHTYAAGVDVSGGVGQDSQALEIFDIETGEQVFSYNNNRIEPDVFARKCALILEEFNNAFLNFERNNHGILFSAEIIKHYRKDRIHQSATPRQRARALERRPEIRKLADYGTFTTDVTKNLFMGRLKKALRDGDIIIYSQELNMECVNFVENGNGQLGAEEGCHDDRVVAAAFAVSVFDRAASVAGTQGRIREGLRGRTTAETFRLDNLLKELENRYDGGDGFPISTGVDESEDSYN